MKLANLTQPREALCEVRNIVLHSHTSRIERFLLLGTIVFMPLENHIPNLAGFSILFILFGVLACYAVVNGPHIVDRIWMHPVLVAAYMFVGFSSLLEFASPRSDYNDVVRFALMIGGAVLFAALCRDRLALEACCYGSMGAALWLGVIILLTSYGTLGGMEATNYDQASQIRVQAFRDLPIHNNINIMAFICSQGGVAALAFALTGSPRRRKLFFAIACSALVASFFPMSRGGIAITILSSAVVLYAYGIKQARVLILVGILGASIFMLVPEGIWSRMVFSTESNDGKMEARASLYVEAFEHVSDYLVTGVGAGNCMSIGDWSCGVHNSFLHVTINWGLIGLSVFLLVIWQAYRCLPERCGRDAIALAVLGIAVSSLLWLFVIHNIYDKVFSLALGMLIASHCWIWPNGIVQPSVKDDETPHSDARFNSFNGDHGRSFTL